MAMLAGPAPPKKRIPKLTGFIGGKGAVGTESQCSLPVRRASSDAFARSHFYLLRPYRRVPLAEGSTPWKSG